MKILLFYFSGTGNTWWPIKEFVRRTQEDHHTVDLYSIEKMLTKMFMVAHIQNFHPVMLPIKSIWNLSGHHGYI
ncbi:MAG: hypothetical protein ACTSYI_04485 [Promethearchaeota archaeon]